MVQLPNMHQLPHISLFEWIQKRATKFILCNMHVPCVLLLRDLVVSAIWLANPSLQMMFLQMVPGDSRVMSSKRWSSSVSSAIC